MKRLGFILVAAVFVCLVFLVISLFLLNGEKDFVLGGDSDSGGGNGSVNLGEENDSGGGVFGAGGAGGAGGGGGGGGGGGLAESVNISEYPCGYYFASYGVCSGTCPEGECVSEGRSCYCKK